MTSELRKLAVAILDKHRLMTLATNRGDGWPQATIVGYANDGLVLYFIVARLSQKFANMSADARVSAAIGSDFSDPNAIKGISLAGRAAIVTESHEYQRAMTAFLSRFPEYADWPRPGAATAPLMRIRPEIISVLDYSKGFGHSDLVTVEDDELRNAAPQPRSDWMARFA